MLSSILIRDFAIIDRLELDLGTGMTALTGETGAGKSILIDAIGLVLGDRADSTVVRTGADKAEISVTYHLENLPEARQWLAEHDFECEDNECTVRRIITRDGRTRAYISGSPVNLQTIRDLGEFLVDIHGQHAHQSLLHRKNQRALLDLQANHPAALEELDNLYREWSRLQAEQSTTDEDIEHRQARLDLISFQCQELEAAAPGSGEAEALEEEYVRLSNTSQLLEAAQSAYGLLYEGEPNINGLLSHATDTISHASAIDSRIQSTVTLLLSAQIEIQESATELRRYIDDLPLDSSRLDEISARIATLQSLSRKHRCQVDDLPEKLRELQAEKAALLDYDDHRARLSEKIRALEEQYFRLASKVSQQRQKAAAMLGATVSDAMQTLGMSGGRFEISVQPISPEKPAAHGIDLIDFQVSANPGQPLRPLTKVASGGELSRISLALQLAATQDLRLPTLIFDEVDSGIGGGIAEIVGRMLRQLGTNRQVLCVTHLPQVAAQAHSQLAVRKHKGQDSTETHIEYLDSTPERIEELARMLGGMEITQQSRAHAEEMLQGAG